MSTANREIQFQGEYNGVEVDLRVDGGAIESAGVSYDHAIGLVLKYYAARQVASAIRTWEQKVKEAGADVDKLFKLGNRPEFEQGKFIAWLRAERSGGEPNEEDKAFGKKAESVFAKITGAAEERSKFLEVGAKLAAAKSGFSLPDYAADVAYNDADFWAKQHRRWRLLKVNLADLL
jgi:hypothetical protein